MKLAGVGGSTVGIAQVCNHLSVTLLLSLPGLLPFYFVLISMRRFLPLICSTTVGLLTGCAKDTEPVPAPVYLLDQRFLDVDYHENQAVIGRHEQ